MSDSLKPQKEFSSVEKVRHSAAHTLAMAVLQVFPKAKLGIGPVIEDGFYYDFEFPRPLTEQDVKEFEKRMRKLVAQNIPFEQVMIPRAEAETMLREQPYKLELLREIPGDEISFFKNADVFIDLCRGPHAASTGSVKAFKLLSTAGAYWRGNEKNTMMTRIYGTAFESAAELDAYVARIEEAKKRDHKKLGRELDLFTFSPLVGSGLPLWTPRGTLLRTLLDAYVWELRSARGYERVEIPHITKKDLYETSGHWDKFKEELFRITTREGHEFAMKPMNCPHHTQIFARKQHSYREMPQRFANTTMVYRDEQSGELAGLSRVRSITQDDAHVFCRPSQVKEEILKIWDMISIFYPSFGFADLRIRLSFHDPEHPEKYLGSPEVWKQAESELREIVREKQMDATEALGEAAFYGPKIDFIAKDSLGRDWQVATIQLDMNLPERFDLSCVNERGEKERVVMIHAAIMGSIERFLSILIEHTAGAFPLWLAPVQVGILPVSDAFNEFAHELKRTFATRGIRVLVHDETESVGKKIRAAEMQKYPYILVVGEKEKSGGELMVRERGVKEQYLSSSDMLLAKLQEKIATREL